MRKLLLFLAMILAVGCQSKYPDVIHVEGGKLHVQGIALDQKDKCLYCSFTSAFFKTDLKGNIIGSVTGINGHLGAMTYDEKAKRYTPRLKLRTTRSAEAFRMH